MFKVRTFQNFYSPASTCFQAWRRWPQGDNSSVFITKPLQSLTVPNSNDKARRWRFVRAVLSLGWQMHATRLKFEVPRCLHPIGRTTSQASGKRSPNHRPSLPLRELWKVNNSCPAWCNCRLIKWSGAGSRRTRVVHLWVSLCKWKVTLGWTKVALTHLKLEKLEGKTKTNDNKRRETSKRMEAKRCVTCGYLHQTLETNPSLEKEANTIDINASSQNDLKTV